MVGNNGDENRFSVMVSAEFSGRPSIVKTSPDRVFCLARLLVRESVRTALITARGPGGWGLIKRPFGEREIVLCTALSGVE